MSSASISPARRPTRFLLIFALAYAGGVIAYLPLLALLLPMKVEALSGDARIGVLTGCVVAGALAASLSNIIFGMLSDRSLARGGGRRRWVAGGVIATAASYAGVAVAGSPWTIVAAVGAFQLAVNALLAPMLAIMADEVPDDRKGLAGGLLALGFPTASVVAALLVGTPALGETTRLAAVPVLTLLCLMPLLLSRAVPIPDTPPAAPRRQMLRRDLIAAWTARLLIQVAGNVLSLYLFYYFESVVPATPPAELAGRVGHLLTVAYILPLPIALLCGRLSDRSGRRQSVLFVAAIVAVAGLFGMGLADSWIAGAAGFAVYAAGSSTFLALHAAFAMQLLPDPRHRGRDLGLLNLTNTLPALVGPLLTWQLATPANFAPVMLVLALLALVGGGATLLIRGER